MVTIDLRVDDLSDDVLVGKSNNKTVFWGVVLILSLDYETLSCIVISLSLYVLVSIQSDLSV